MNWPKSVDAWLAFSLCFCLSFFFPMLLFLAIPLGFFFVEQQAEESMENKMLFCLLFSSEQAIYGTTGFIISGLCGYNRQISSGSGSFLYFVILCSMRSFRPFKTIWMEQRKSLRVYMLFLCQSFNNNGFHLQTRNTFKRTLLFAPMICRWAGCIAEQLG